MQHTMQGLFVYVIEEDIKLSAFFTRVAEKVVPSALSPVLLRVRSPVSVPPRLLVNALLACIVDAV
jgi:hypothetical protein